MRNLSAHLDKSERLEVSDVEIKEALDRVKTIS